MHQHEREIAERDRFEFGKNWAAFLETVDERKIQAARESFCAMLGINELRGKTFLDIGSGSGLCSLVAKFLGASVFSFDFDPHSVACTKILREKYFKNDESWRIEQGSILDRDYVARLGKFDVVYSWGVLHHTGEMWAALANAGSCVAQNGTLFVAIYNDQGWISRYWRTVKRMHNKMPLSKPVLFLIHFPYLFGVRFFLRLASGRLKLERGMNLWHDMLDWLGGFPFEVAKPEEIHEFYRLKGFVLARLRTCGGRHGCNEFVFTRE